MLYTDAKFGWIKRMLDFWHIFQIDFWNNQAVLNVPLNVADTKFFVQIANMTISNSSDVLHAKSKFWIILPMIVMQRIKKYISLRIVRTLRMLRKKLTKIL